MEYLIVLSIGIILMVISFLLFKSNIDFFKNGIKTLGTIVDIEMTIDGEGNKSFLPILKFTNIENKNLISRNHRSSNYSLTYKIGEEIIIIYNPKNPNDVKFLTYSTFNWAIGVLISSMPFLIIGGGYFITLPILN